MTCPGARPLRALGCCAQSSKVEAMTRGTWLSRSLPPDIAAMSFEDALAELETIVKPARRRGRQARRGDRRL